METATQPAETHTDVKNKVLSRNEALDICGGKFTANVMPMLSRLTELVQTVEDSHSDILQSFKTDNVTGFMDDMKNVEKTFERLSDYERKVARIRKKMREVSQRTSRLVQGTKDLEQKLSKKEAEGK